MMRGNVAPVLRSFGFVGFVCCASIVGPGAALAGDAPAHVDSAQPHGQPFYPDSARAAGEQGTVEVQVQVKSSGHLGKYRVAQSSGYGDLDNAAVESVLNWRFVPAVRNGDTVTDWATVNVVYQLPQEPAGTATPQAR